jgi:hypothetical protein
LSISAKNPAGVVRVSVKCVYQFEKMHERGAAFCVFRITLFFQTMFGSFQTVGPACLLLNLFLYIHFYA